MNKKDERFLKKLCENSSTLLELFHDLSEEQQLYILNILKEIAKEEKPAQTDPIPDPKEYGSLSGTCVPGHLCADFNLSQTAE